MRSVSFDAHRSCFLEPPIGVAEAARIREGIAPHLRDCVSGTLAYVAEHSSGERLTEAIVNTWRRTSLRLRELAEDVCHVRPYFCNTSGLFGLFVEFRSPLREPILQQAPVTPVVVGRALSRFGDSIPQCVVDVFGAASGLMFTPNITLALPEFINAPFNRFHKARLGDEWTADSAVRADMYGPAPDQYSCELLWIDWGHAPDFILLDRHMGSAVFRDSDSDDWRFKSDCCPSLNIDTCELLDRLFVRPTPTLASLDDLLSPATPHLKMRRPGDQVRALFDGVSTRERVSIALEVAECVVTAADRAPWWRHVRHLLSIWKTRHTTGTAILSPGMRGLAASLLDRSAYSPARNQQYQVVTFVVFCLQPLARYFAGSAMDVPYPDVKLLPDASVRPLYEYVAERIRTLRDES